MLGRNHSTIGSVTLLAIAPAVSTDPATVLIAATCAAGAAVLPDLDHPNAAVSRVIPIIGPLVARGVSLLAGGHRNRTHTIEAGAVATGAAWVAAASRPVAAGIIAVLVCLAAALLGPHLRLVTVASLAEFAVAVAAGVAVLQFDGIRIEWLPGAVAIGFGAHLLTDAVTVSGIRPLLIAPRAKLHLGRLRTGGVTETAIGGLAVVALAALVYLRIAQPILETSR